tara:strand:- start:2609 stop:3250 length:642 start_codon:yes stop_codon:yes gene_type:complete
MSDEQNLIKEVNEEVRQDNYKRTWNKYKKYIFFIVLSLLIGVTSVNYLQSSKEKTIEKQSELFFKAIEYIDNQDFENAKKLLEEINESQRSGYSDLAFLYLVDLVNKKEIDLDLNELELKKKSNLYPLVILQKFNNEINLDFENIENIDEIINLSKPSSSWKYLAHELLASYYLKKKDIDNALQSLNTIIESNEASEYIKERAKTLVEIINKK